MKKTATLILVVFFSLPAFAENPAAGQPGPWGVGRAFFEFSDTSRLGHSLAPGDYRYIPVEVWYPTDPGNITGSGTTYGLFPDRSLAVGPSGFAEDDRPVAAGKFPLLVFSHGFEAVSLQSTQLMELVASHGFIVVSADHQGNNQFYPPENGYTAIDAAFDRILDVSFLIDTFTNLAYSPVGLTGNSVDVENIGVFGHSYGGSTTMGSVTGWVGAPGDDRVKAIFPISGVFTSDNVGITNPFFSDEDLQDVSVPVFLLGGTLDTTVPIDKNNDRAFGLIPAVNGVYQVDVIDAVHGSFGSICAIAGTFINVPALGIDPNQNLADQVIPQLDTILSLAGMTKVEVETMLGIQLDPMIELLSDQYDETCRPPALDNDEVVRLTALYAVSFFKHYLQDDNTYDENLDPAATHDSDVVFKQKTISRSSSGGGSMMYLLFPLMLLVVFRRRHNIRAQ